MGTAIEICTQVFDDVSVSLGSSWDDGQPRIRDTDLALALGLAQPRDIRKLIKRHEGTPEFGDVYWRATVARQRIGHNLSAEREYEVEECWLLDWQALFIASKSETKAGACILAKMSKAFVSARSFVPAGIAAISRPQQSDEILKAIFRMQEESSRLREDSSALIRSNQEMLVEMRSSRIDTENRFNLLISDNREIKEQLVSQSKQLSEVQARQVLVRRDFTKVVKRKYRVCVVYHYSMKCPCCMKEQILASLDGNTTNLQYDHWFASNRNGIHEGWPVCMTCNQKLGHAGETNNRFRQEVRDSFQAFHRHLRKLNGEDVEQLNILGVAIGGKLN